jgi:hypothetical protein
MCQREPMGLCFSVRHVPNHSFTSKEFIVSRHTTQPRAESWKAGAREREGSVQARAVGITALGWTGWWPTRHRPIGPCLEGLGPWFLKKANCQDTYELLSNSVF